MGVQASHRLIPTPHTPHTPWERPWAPATILITRNHCMPSADIGAIVFSRKISKYLRFKEDNVGIIRMHSHRSQNFTKT